jgi:outer membrane protein assembly factor BamB
MRLVPYAFVGVSAVALMSACGSGGESCQTSRGVTVCGTFGQSLYVADLGNEPVQWPPVAVQQGRIVLSRGSELVEIRADGTVAKLTDAGQSLSAPSADDVGGLYAIGGGKAGTNVLAWNPSMATGKSADKTTRWTRSVDGTPVGTPPSLGQDVVYAATTRPADGSTLYALDRKDGTVLRQRADASPAAVLTDGSIRYLANAKGVTGTAGAPRYTNLVAEAADGTTLWTYKASEGLVDFAPGPDRETYVVGAGNHELRRIGADGQVAWSFTPPCKDCNVAAAPTVSNGTVYFPVWENRVQNPVDPLYALSAKDGKQVWTFDGFDTTQVSYAPYKAFSQPVDQTRTTHHPTGRPVVAQDGTLFVSNDGAVASLDKDGQVLGIAMYDASAGEVHWTDTFVEPVQTWINPGVRPSPVLGPDGVLYVWDGVTVRAFQTHRPAAVQAWIAPFGGPTNSGRIPQ